MNPSSAPNVHLTSHQEIVVVALSLLLLAFVIYMVRRRAIREEYSILWLAAGAVAVVLTVFYDLTVAVARLLGAVVPTTVVFLLGILFLVVLNIQMTVVLSRQRTQINRLAKELALLSEKRERGE